MYVRTQETIDAIIARNLENTAPSVPALTSYFVKSIGDHEHIVRFFYEEQINPFVTAESERTFNGRTWS